jgi:hypothetical protein
MSRNLGASTSWNPLGLSRPVMGLLYLFIYIQQQRSYADETKSNKNQIADTAITLTKFLNEFKGLFNQLLQQNSMILNLLAMLTH